MPLSLLQNALSKSEYLLKNNKEYQKPLSNIFTAERERERERAGVRQGVGFNELKN